ncbi:hemicentin-1 [Silurus meridionalis]|nr:hemicentin-1 [Silurus meridionalis]
METPVPPTIMNSDPADVSAQVGEELTLKCHAEGTPTPQLTWMRNGVKVDTSERVHVSANGSTLTLLRVTEDDSGIYKCLAVSPAGQESKVYSLLVLAPAMVKHTEPMEHIVIVRGSVVSLVCEAHGVPSPVFTWLKDGDLLSLHQNKLLHDGGESRFQLLNVQLEDTGLYSCIAKNQAGNSSKTFNLTVLEPPKISSSLRREELMVVVNGVLEMECLVDGVPPPTAEDAAPPKPWSDITTVSVPFMGHMTLECRTDGKIPPDIQWYKDDIKLQLGGRIQSIAGGQYLDIGDVRQEDSGNYSCVMFNMAGSSSLHFNVQILLHPVIREGSPLVTAHVNQKVVLPCEVEGDTAPSVLWRKDGVPVVFNNSPEPEPDPNPNPDPGPDPNPNSESNPEPDPNPDPDSDPDPDPNPEPRPGPDSNPTLNLTLNLTLTLTLNLTLTLTLTLTPALILNLTLTLILILNLTLTPALTMNLTLTLILNLYTLHTPILKIL